MLEEHGRVPIGDGEPMLEALEGYRPLGVVVETCPFWPWIHDTLEPTEIGFHLAHASELEAIAKAETKTDSVDARLLARMLAAKLIPEVYPKPASQREIVHLVRHRSALVTERTRLVCRIHSHLHQQGLQIAREKLLRQGGSEVATAGGLAVAERRAAGPGRDASGPDRHPEPADRAARRPDRGEEPGASGRLAAADDPGHRALPEPAPGRRGPAGFTLPFAGPPRLLCGAGTADPELGRNDPLRKHTAGGQSVGARGAGLGHSEPHALHAGQLPGHLLRTAKRTNRVAEGPCGHRPQTVPGPLRHALHGRGMAGLSPTTFRRTGVSSSRFMQLRLPSLS